MKLYLRFRINSEGLLVWNNGTWYKADENIVANVRTIMYNLYK